MCYLSGQRKVALCWRRLAFVKQCACSRARGGLRAGIRPSSEAAGRLSAREVFHHCEVPFRWFSRSLPVNAGLPGLCKSLPPGWTVLPGHPGFLKECVIVSGRRERECLSLGCLIFALPSGFQLSAFHRQPGRQDGRVLIRSGA